MSRSYTFFQTIPENVNSMNVPFVVSRIEVWQRILWSEYFRGNHHHTLIASCHV